MPSPFPGMDPYLESPAVWLDFHNGLAERIRAVLNERLPDRYYAQLEARTEVGISEETERVILPDVSVRRSVFEAESGVVAVAEPRLEISSAYEIAIEAEPAELSFIEIRDAYEAHEVVTLIEILSLSDKRPGEDRNKFLEKRRQVFESKSSLVEIDLLRSGKRLWEQPTISERFFSLEPSPDYLVTVNRAWRRKPNFRLQVFPIALRGPLPVIAVPLRESDAELPFDLQYCFQQTYDAGPYRRGAVDYTRPPEPPLPEQHREWAAERVSEWLAAR